jgi:hypothetical protein
MHDNSRSWEELKQSGLPDNLIEAYADSQALIFSPETSAVLKELEHDPDRDAKLREQALAGHTGAMLIFARIERAQGRPEKWFALTYAAFARGSGQAAYELAYDAERHDLPSAFELYKQAIERGHLGARYRAVNLLREHSPDGLALTVGRHEALLADYLRLADEVMNREVFNALVTGSHPVQFLGELGIPWGTGTFFLVRWKGEEFAITARHCILASDADPVQAQLIVPHREGPIPFLGHFAVADDEKVIDDERDVFLWKIGEDRSGNDQGWWSWRLDHLWKPASELCTGQKIFLVGYPNVEERVDYERGKLEPHCLVIRGELAKDSLGDLLAVDCADFDVTVDGVSGGPVYAMFHGIFFFVGMAVRGDARAKRIYFIDATHVIAALEQTLKK